jgi:hypothetical protein
MSFMVMLFMFQVLLYNTASINYVLNFYNCDMNNKSCPWGRIILERKGVARISNSVHAFYKTSYHIVFHQGLVSRPSA